MISKTIYIKYPSKILLELLMGMRQQREINRGKLLLMEDVYFSKNKTTPSVEKVD